MSTSDLPLDVRGAVEGGDAAPEALVGKDLTTPVSGGRRGSGRFFGLFGSSKKKVSHENLTQISGELGGTT